MSYSRFSSDKDKILRKKKNPRSKDILLTDSGFRYKNSRDYNRKKKRYTSVFSYNSEYTYSVNKFTTYNSSSKTSGSLYREYRNNRSMKPIRRQKMYRHYKDKRSSSNYSMKRPRSISTYFSQSHHISRGSRYFSSRRLSLDSKRCRKYLFSKYLKSSQRNPHTRSKKYSKHRHNYIQYKNDTSTSNFKRNFSLPYEFHNNSKMSTKRYCRDYDRKYSRKCTNYRRYKPYDYTTWNSQSKSYFSLRSRRSNNHSKYKSYKYSSFPPETLKICRDDNKKKKRYNKNSYTSVSSSYVSYLTENQKDSRIKITKDKSTKKNDDIVHFNWVPKMRLNRRYVVKSQLGEGTFGRVLECTDKHTGESVAVKVVRDVSRHTSAARFEAGTLKTIKEVDETGSSNCVFLIDSFLLDTRRRKTSQRKYYRRESRRSRTRNRSSVKNYDLSMNRSGSTLNSSSKYGKGVHMCLVFEKLGPSLFSFLSRNNYCGFFMEDIKHISCETLKALAFLKEIKLTHTDLKPENILLVNGNYERVSFPRSRYPRRFWDGDATDSELLPSDNDYSILSSSSLNSETSYSGACNSKLDKFHYSHSDPITVKRPLNCNVKLIDFGSATFEYEEHAKVINTRQYRAPEVILRWSMASDMWCLGCILFELYTGIVLFRTHERFEHLVMMEKIIGPFPQHLLAQSAKTDMKQYISYNRKENLYRLKWPEMASNSSSIKRLSRCFNLSSMILPCHSLFYDFLKILLVFDPKERATPIEALNHPFLKNHVPEA